MQVATAKRTVISDNLGEKTSFKIAQNSHAFKILSDSLYSDKITAICRELCTNAYDSHKVAGQDRPYEVKLPNMIDPNFFVRDFGTGLSQERVMNLFSTYFMSDKSQNNDCVGGFGLGSKSPFSYTDSFSVISSFAGKRTIYNAYISDVGCPEIVVMGEPTDCGDETGLEISFPVRREDHRNFSDKLAKVVRYFKMQPIVSGNPSFKAETVEYVHEGTGWAVRQTSGYYGNNSDANIIMGGVAYPVDVKQFKEDGDDYYGNLYTKFLDEPIDIFMEIGEVAINPSREALNYRKEDIKTIKARVDAIAKEVTKDVTADVLKQPSLWDAFVAFHLWEAKGGLFAHAMGVRSGFSVDYKGEKLTHDWQHPKKEFGPNMAFKTFEGGRLRALINRNVMKETKAAVEASKPGVTPVVLAQPAEEHNFFTSMTPSPRVKIIFDDVKSNGLARFQHWKYEYELNKDREDRSYSSRYQEYYFVYDPTAKARNAKKPQTFSFPALTVEDVSKFFLGATILKTSDMALPPEKEKELADAKSRATGEKILNMCMRELHIDKDSEGKIDFRGREEQLTTSRDKLVAKIKEYKKEGTVIYVRQDNPRQQYPSTFLNSWGPGLSNLYRTIDVLAATGIMKKVTVLRLKDDGLLQKIAEENGVVEANKWIDDTLNPLIKSIDLTGSNDLALFTKKKWLANYANRSGGKMISALRGYQKSKRKGIKISVFDKISKTVMDSVSSDVTVQEKYASHIHHNIESAIDNTFSKNMQNDSLAKWTKEVADAIQQLQIDLAKYPLILRMIESQMFTSSNSPLPGLYNEWQQYVDLIDNSDKRVKKA